MLSQRHNLQASSGRYYSEEHLEALTIVRRREGAISNHQKYHKKASQTKTLTVSTHDPLINSRNVKQSLVSLPRINAKILKHPVNYSKLVAQRPVPRKQTYLFKHKPQHLKNMINPQMVGLHEYAHLSNEGQRIKNQDRISIQTLEVEEKLYEFFGVYDGHGGHMASTYLKNHLHLIIRQCLLEGKQPKEALAQGLKRVEEKLRKNSRLAHKSGSCATICLIEGNSCWIANVGDCRLLSISQNNQVVQITRDHKPEDDAQRKRIQYHGGQVYRNSRDTDIQDVSSSSISSSKKLPFRVYPGNLSVTRTIGDIHIKKQHQGIIIPQPDIYHMPISGLSYLILFSDGVYQTLSNNQIGGSIITEGIYKGVDKIFAKAVKNNSQDNRSLVVIKL